MRPTTAGKLIPRVLMTAISLLVILLAVVLIPFRAWADPRTDCPPPGPCKVITLNAEEEKALLGPNMVLDTAVAGRQIDLFGVASYFRNKIQNAPAGDMPKPAEAPAKQ